MPTTVPVASTLLVLPLIGLIGCATGEATSDGQADAPPGTDHNILFPDTSLHDGAPAREGPLSDGPVPMGSITVTAPVGGETWPAGSASVISWSSSGIGSSVDIELWKGGAKRIVIVTGQASSGSYSWSVGADLPHGDDYTVKVLDPVSGTEGSSPAFTIENWRYRIKVTVTATKALAGFQVPIDLDPSTFSYQNAASNGADVRLSTTQVPGVFDLPHWVESWDSSGQSRVWVRVGTLPANKAVDLYLFYGLATASSTSSQSATFPNQLVSSGDMTLSGIKSYDWFELKSGHTLTLATGQPLSIQAPRIIIAGDIDGVGRGETGGTAGGSGNGPGGGGGSTNSGGGGGSYGGKGGLGGHDAADTPGAGGPTHGNSSGATIQMGSGGGAGNTRAGGAGGGALLLGGHQITINGGIQMDGAPGIGGGQSSGGGSGGGILVQAEEITLTGTCAARGGKGGTGTITANDGGGGGGGGRVKLLYGTSIAVTGQTIVSGGAGGQYGDAASGQPGAAGTSTNAQQAFSPVAVTLGAEETIQ